MAISLMRRRNLTAPGWLWSAMSEATAARGTTVAAAVREMMLRYVREVERDGRVPQFIAERDNPKSPPKVRPRIGAYEADKVRTVKRRKRARK